MAPVAGPSSQRKSHSLRGAPSQYTRTGRKGKKAWRKNVDIEEVEQGLEEMRKEEEAVGVPLQKQADSDLFTFDAAGDAAIRKSLPKKLTHAQQVLSARSAVPALNALLLRPTSENAVKRRAKMTYQEKQRLLRIAGRTTKGPMNTITNPRKESSEGVGLTMQASYSRGRDVWSEADKETEFVNGLKEGDQKEYLPELVMKLQIKPPKPDRDRKMIAMKAVVQPHEGTSYNPHVAAHRELLQTAVAIEERREIERNALATAKAAAQAGAATIQEGPNVERTNGMVVDLPEKEKELEVAEDGTEEPVIPVQRKATKAKTTRDRNAEARQLAMKTAHLEKLRLKKLNHSINFAKLMDKEVAARLSAKDKALLERRMRRKDRFKAGLAGKKLGSKHIVPRGEIDVQLGEDLSKNLQGLKVEGNLFRDRLLSMQQRALVEPRSLANPSRKRKQLQIKEYEKYAWKYFERPVPHF
ncbi:hypothetical protein FRB94_013281 [Tulasnella sp. JGI-2019a]|nr:hypothetical protein FRB93_007956 [Tulasnella sp. JGI-2019a]KAG8990576.1 hypothetical protein FRB94_013281 [Tulasnella sp. JGI-2019a]